MMRARALALVALLLALPAQAADRCVACGPTCHLRWDAYPDAVSYEVRRWDTGALLGATEATGLDFACTGLKGFDIIVMGLDAQGAASASQTSELVWCMGEAGDMNSDGEISSSDLTRWMRVLFLATGSVCSLPRRE